MSKPWTYTYDQELKDLADLENKVRQFKTIVTIALLVITIFLIRGCNSPALASELQASYYSETSLKKEGTWRKSVGIMANGRKFNENALSCATRLYPLGTHLIITNLSSGKSVNVVVTDRIGRKYAKSRIDLSKGAFLRIGNISSGLVPIDVKRIDITVK